MKLLSKIRSRSRLRNADAHGSDRDPLLATGWAGRPARANVAAKLPTPMLKLIFSFVCPHVEDESYEPLEDSMIDDGCMLCDMRDLAKCAAVCRGWQWAAQELLYHTVRIDAVHYCERELELSEKRKHRSFFERNGDPKDIPQERLHLFSRTIREREVLAARVQFLKMPYMTRETCKADLARAVSVLPNLQYVDLPDGFFGDDASCLTLRQELQARCPELRKMKYASGSEASFALVAARQSWQLLEMVELSALNVEVNLLLQGLGSLPVIREVKITDMPWLDDGIFVANSSTLSFPAVQKLSLENTPNVTAQGLSRYLSRPEAQEVLSYLSLITTGILPSTLHQVLHQGSHLTHVAITETVTQSFPLDPVPPLSSTSLETLYFEITAASTPTARGVDPAQSHYAYLTRSLHSAALPTLRSLYVRDSTFPESLTLVPPAAPFATTPSSFSNRNPRAQGFNQRLDVYSKGLDELEWNFTCVSPPTAAGKRGTFAPLRPISAYRVGIASTDNDFFPGAAGGGALLSPKTANGPRSAGLPYMTPLSSPRGVGGGGGGGGGFLSPGVSPPRGASGAGPGGETRKSVIVGNGFGGFLAVPDPSGATVGVGAPRGASHLRNASGGFLPAAFGGSGAGRAAAGDRSSRADIWR